jgi:hypothetical protein
VCFSRPNYSSELLQIIVLCIISLRGILFHTDLVWISLLNFILLHSVFPFFVVLLYCILLYLNEHCSFDYRAAERLLCSAVD